MTSFIETPRFPDFIAFWARGGQGWKTTVTTTYGGDEYRNQPWAQSRGEWEISDAFASWNPASSYSIVTVRNFHLTVRGMLYAFRFKDYNDYKDEGIGTFTMIDSTHFQVSKTYAISPLSYVRPIVKPISPIVVTGGTVSSIDYTTGIVTMTSGTPTSWTGEFDCPVRFDTDLPQIGRDPSGALNDWQSLKLIEVKNL